jgi:hypothetical protein
MKVSSDLHQLLQPVGDREGFDLDPLPLPMLVPTILLLVHISDSIP